MKPEEYIAQAIREGTAAPSSLAGRAVALARTGRPAMPARYGARMMFAGAQNDRLTASWGSTPMTADAIVLRNQRALVARSREQSANNDYAKAFLRICRQNIAGPLGPQLNMQLKKPSGAMDAEVNSGIEYGWSEWGKAENCDITGKRTWRKIVKSCVNTMAKDGEFMVRIVVGADAGPWGFAVQTLDPQRCPVDYNEPARGDGSFVRHGIRFNRYGRPLEYAFTEVTQSQENHYYGGGMTAGVFTWIPASEIIHGFIEDMEGQKRGLPWMATGLFRMRHLNGFEDAAITNARVGAAKMGFIKWQPGFGPELEDGEEPPQIEAEPGVFETLPEGAELQDWAPQFPSESTGPLIKHLLRGTSAGFGVPYNEFANDLEGVNFSSIRQGTLDSRENWKDLQEELIEMLPQRVFGSWLDYSLLSGRVKSASGRPLNITKAGRYKAAAMWQARRWDWIDPRADTQSAVDRKNNFLTSPSAIIREQGKDPGDVWTETARDMRAMVDALVAEGFDEKTAKELVLLSMGQQPPKITPEVNKDEPAATE